MEDSSIPAENPMQPNRRLMLRRDAETGRLLGCLLYSTSNHRAEDCRCPGNNPVNGYGYAHRQEGAVTSSACVLQRQVKPSLLAFSSRAGSPSADWWEHVCEMPLAVLEPLLLLK